MKYESIKPVFWTVGILEALVIVMVLVLFFIIAWKQSKNSYDFFRVWSMLCIVTAYLWRIILFLIIFTKHKKDDFNRHSNQNFIRYLDYSYFSK